MNRIYTIVLVFLTIHAFSQQVSPEVIASAGDHFENNDISLSWTLGEPVISTFTGDYILTQGFHQDLYIITAIDEVEVSQLDIQIFPNPTPDFVNIQINQNQKDLGNIKIQLLDLKGSLLQEVELSKLTDQTKLNLQSYQRSQYYLRIIINDKIITYKIVKT
jgi:hypothetical protein